MRIRPILLAGAILFGGSEPIVAQMAELPAGPVRASLQTVGVVTTDPVPDPRAIERAVTKGHGRKQMAARSWVVMLPCVQSDRRMVC